MKKNHIALLLVLSMLAIGVTSPGYWHAWQWDGNELVQMKSSDLNRLIHHNLNQPDVVYEAGAECFTLANEGLEIFKCGENTKPGLWVSPESWKIKEILAADLNRDGIKEFGLLVWRPFKPWPIDRFLPSGGRIAEFHNLQGESCHLVLIGWDGEEYRELWAGSALANPISQLQAVDINGDGFDELIALESEYDSGEPGGPITLWQWQGFGFSLVDRLEGNFAGYAVVNFEEQPVILTD